MHVCHPNTQTCLADIEARHGVPIKYQRWSSQYADKALFRDPQHPSDEGNELMGARLVPIVEKVVLGRK